MYHRIADVMWDPWGLAVSPARFAEQMQALLQVRLPLTMDDFVACLDRGALPRNAIAVTFDDGYVDNLLFAQPVLERLKIPATVFVTTHNTGVRQEFWWDELTRLILKSGEAISCTVSLCGSSKPDAVDLPLTRRRKEEEGGDCEGAGSEPKIPKRRGERDASDEEQPKSRAKGQYQAKGIKAAVRGAFGGDPEAGVR